ncbi:12356_t:CDS:2, partial [Entrophospora sp. SA101]
LIPMHPWYRGFYGRIQKIDENKYVSYGIIAKKAISITYCHFRISLETIARMKGLIL